MQSIHKTVLLHETIDGLDLKNGSIVLDATFGGGGHSLQICKKFPGVKIIALDQDANALEKAKSKFENIGCDIFFVNANFGDLGDFKNFSTYYGASNFPNPPGPEFDGIIFDLGLSSDQLENSGRGFSFLKNEPLLMTMKENPRPEDLTAADIVNSWEEKSLADVIYGYGEEKYSRKIARAIVEVREKKEIKTTFELVEIIGSAVPAVYKRGRLHFATRTFQALRIAVNDELRVLQRGLEEGFKILKGGGRMAVISFHSLEDRIVKKFFKEMEKEEKAILINKKPIVPQVEELNNNPRARSAKLRILEKIKI